jgi:hypothetical protein
MEISATLLLNVFVLASARWALEISCEDLDGASAAYAAAPAAYIIGDKNKLTENDVDDG